MKSSDEMSVLFGNYKEAISNTCVIADKCNFDFSFDKLYLPTFKVPNERPDEYLRTLTNKGLEKRLQNRQIIYNEKYTEQLYKDRSCGRNKKRNRG